MSGIPSTLHALLTGGDPAEATHAAGAMLVPSETRLPALVAAAVLVHSSVSFFWTLVLWATLPRRRTMLWAFVASMAIALLDLRLIAPTFFPQVAALAFWPQLADHLMWGACVGFALRGRRADALRPGRSLED